MTIQEASKDVSNVDHSFDTTNGNTTTNELIFDSTATTHTTSPMHTIKQTNNNNTSNNTSNNNNNIRTNTTPNMSSSSSISSSISSTPFLVNPKLNNNNNSNSHHYRNSSVSSISPQSSLSNSPIFLKSITTTNLPTIFSPQKNKFVKPIGVNLITAIELGKLLLDLDDSNNNLLIFDVRSFNGFSKSSIKNSIHLTLPSTLLKRRTFTFNRLLENLSPIDQQTIKEKHSTFKTNLKIILYDDEKNENSDDLISSICYNMSLKILDHFVLDQTTPLHDSISISVLSSGFQQFEVLFPQYIDYSNSNINPMLNSNSNSNSNSNVLDNDLKIAMPEFSKPNIFLSKSTPTTNSNPNSFLNKNLSPLSLNSESPISSSSPISALLKFQLPNDSISPKPLFKFKQNEEIMNLESYLSAVNIKEEREENQKLEFLNKLDEESSSSILANDLSPIKSINLSSSISQNSISTFCNSNSNDYKTNSNFQFPKKRKSIIEKDKLKFQIRYLEMIKNYPIDMINKIIPSWFQDLMKLNKIQFILQYQKLDQLERKRLNKCLSNSTSNLTSKKLSNSFKFPTITTNNTTTVTTTTTTNSMAITNNILPESNPFFSKDNSNLQFHKIGKILEEPISNINTSQSTMNTTQSNLNYSQSNLSYSQSNLNNSQPTLTNSPSYDRRALSHSDFMNLTKSRKKYTSLDLDDDDEDDFLLEKSYNNNMSDSSNKIIISSGVELGNKNRYKDIFPFEHSRVVLKKKSFSLPIPISTDSFLQNNSKTNSISIDLNENYINASYLNLPQLVFENNTNMTSDTTTTTTNINNNNTPISSSSNSSTCSTITTPISGINYSSIEPTSTNFNTTANNSNLNNNGTSNNNSKTTIKNDKFYKTSRKLRYIATQAPLLSTVHDFYTCILNNNVPIIICLTDQYENSVEKCFDYWSEGNYNGIHVKLLDELSIGCNNNFIKLNNQYTENHQNCLIVRIIELTYTINNKECTFKTLQLQIKDWPDFGTLVDPTKIVQAINLKDKVIDKLFGNNFFAEDYIPTIVVHCSAGCGRTGTWCTVDSALSNLQTFEKLNQEFKNNMENNAYDDREITITNNNIGKENKKIFDPISWTINIFRKQRISMVQNINQYLFIYDCLIYYFTLKLHENCSFNDKREITPLTQNYLNSMTKFLDELDELEFIDNFVKAKTTETLPTFI
ncbi:hypothetical protein TBLA_0C04790 [Henningerozyma blattae CBS 6284]|uniref:protein-tyrosine-phosphatase n=1 Tax=Henningerozyma blattae (strain ATCC 34711 / CBS 6284 / DSM 70876 / NBRC 10599 / NRRL Y-10934 / UCD 77-7) TaxID=1071380 RepID=I2H1M3_HENB6|nr:hypothetical protein TBLA_0C04790 [Tetrapisispora blattae CBS 6284]CCH60275.1 hypothetical protein TBLA_0C04790 [Tetrapisispora blattae CBS 6284]